MIYIWLHIDLRVNFWKKIIYLFFAGHLGRQIIRVQNFVKKKKKKIAGQMILSLSKKNQNENENVNVMHSEHCVPNAHIWTRENESNPL